MKRNLNTFAVSCAASISLMLAGCGGGGDGYVAVAAGAPLVAQFLFWNGSSGGDRVIDGLGHTFAFYSDNGCLKNFQTGSENNAFCLAPGTSFVNYGSFHGQIVNVLITDGSCHAAILDSGTGNFSDIELDAFGREIVLTTDLHPAVCG